MLRHLAVALVLLGSVAAASAQDAPDAEPRRVILTDGTVLVGTVADEAADPLVVVTENGIEQRIPRDRVAEIAPLYAGRFTRLDPNRTRLFLAPTGRTLGRGAGRLSAYYVFPTVAYGVSDRIDLSAGAFASFDGDGFFGILNANVKGQVVRTERVAVALGANAVVPLASADAGTVGGTLYAVGTLGAETQALSLGVIGAYGVDVDAGDAALGEGVALLAGYERQLSNGVKLISENYLFVGDGAAGVLGLGPRFFGDHFAFDLAGALVVAEGGVYGFGPLVNFAYNFGR